MTDKLVVEEDLYKELEYTRDYTKYRLHSVVTNPDIEGLIEPLTPDEEILVLRYLGGDDNVELVNKDIERGVQLSKGDIVQLPNGDKVRVTHSVAIKVKTV